MGLDGRVAIVTGASGAIGGSIARELAARGAFVVVNGRRRDPTEATARTITDDGGRAVVVVGDATEPETVAALVETARRDFGRLDIVVNNVGGRDGAAVRDLDVAKWDQVMSANLRGAFLLTKAAVTALAANGCGRVVNFSSVASSGTIGQANYATAKAAVEGLTRTLALELGPEHITVNCLVLGVIETEKSTASMGPLVPLLVERTPLRRAGTPADVAGVVAFLASDDAAFITGETLRVSGGLRWVGPDLMGG